MQEISLVITVSRFDFLKEALVSIGAQQSHDFELIVVVDISKISSEETVNMVNSICNHPASRTKFCFINGNGSAGRVRNAGFSMTKTRWISYMDDDDIITPDALKTVLEAIPRMEKDKVGFFSSFFQ